MREFGVRMISVDARVQSLPAERRGVGRVFPPSFEINPCLPPAGVSRADVDSYH